MSNEGDPKELLRKASTGNDIHVSKFLDNSNEYAARFFSKNVKVVTDD